MPKVLATLLGIPLKQLRGRTMRCSFMGFPVTTGPGYQLGRLVERDGQRDVPAQSLGQAQS